MIKRYHKTNYNGIAYYIIALLTLTYSYFIFTGEINGGNTGKARILHDIVIVMSESLGYELVSIPFFMFSIFLTSRGISNSRKYKAFKCLVTEKYSSYLEIDDISINEYILKHKEIMGSVMKLLLVAYKYNSVHAFIWLENKFELIESIINNGDSITIHYKDEQYVVKSTREFIIFLYTYFPKYANEKKKQYNK